MIVITHPEILPNEHGAIAALFAEGLGCLHVRKPNFSRAQMQAFLQGIPAQYHPQLMVHSHYELLSDFALRGLHFPFYLQADYKSYEQLNCCKSWALHSLNEMATLPLSVDYAFLSPVFPSISKHGYWADWDLGALKASLAKSPNCVALGGISPHTMADAFTLGFSNVAVLGSIWKPLKESGRVADVLVAYRALDKAHKLAVANRRTPLVGILS